jgi:hypothetical protein
MKKPTISTYESWFLDYMDGALNKEQILLLQAFIKLNPSLKEEFELLQDYKSSDFNKLPAIKYPHKEDLLKNNTNHTLSYEKLVALFEKDLTIDSIDINDFHHEANQAYLKRLEQSKLKANQNIVYPDKEKITKKAPILFSKSIAYWSSIAAVFLIGIFLTKWNKQEKNIEYKQNTLAYSESTPIELKKNDQNNEEKLERNISIQKPITQENANLKNVAVTIENAFVQSHNLQIIKTKQPLVSGIQTPIFEYSNNIDIPEIQTNIVATLKNENNNLEPNELNKRQIKKIVTDIINTVPGVHYNNHKSDYSFSLQVGTLSIKAK